MGSIGNTARQAAWTGQVFPKGIDLRRSTINNDLGTYVALDSATIRAGQFVTYDANAFIIAATGAGVIGVAKWDKQTVGVSVNVDEVLTLNGTTATNLKRTNISNASVRSAANFGGTLYTVTTDYTVNTTNGTVTRVGAGAIADGGVVYVTYTYALIDADFEIDGKTFRNQSNNAVLGQENRFTVITDWARLYTMEYDSTAQYALTSANFRLFCTSEGKASTVAANDFVGRVHQLPTADDPFLGITIHGNPV